MTAPIDNPKWQPFFAVIFIILGIWESVSSIRRGTFEDIVMASVFIASGVLLFTRLRDLTRYVLYLGAGIMLFHAGLDKDNYLPLVIGSSMIVVLVIGVFEGLLRRARIDSLTRRN